MFQVANPFKSSCMYRLEAVRASSGGYPRSSARTLEQYKTIYDAGMVFLQRLSTEELGLGITGTTPLRPEGEGVGWGWGGGLPPHLSPA